MKKNLCLIHNALAVAIASSVGVASSVSAQVLEEVIVTANKRVEVAQDIPITVSVVSGEKVEQFSTLNAVDLAKSVPGLTIADTPQNLGSPRIRGLGTGSGSSGVDQSVGLFVDGVWSGRERELQSALYDLERVEVIKGTQTSQLGKNTSLGAISVFSHRPERENSSKLQVEYEAEHESYFANGFGNITTDFGDYRLAFKYVDEQGYVNNRLGDDEVPERDQTSFRLSGSWALGDKGSVYASYSYDDFEIIGDAFQISSDPMGWYSRVSGDADVRLDNQKLSWTNYTSDGEPLDEQKANRAVIEVSYSLTDDLTLVSLSGYSDYENRRALDAEFSATEFLEQDKNIEYEQWSQEVRLSGVALNDKLDFTTGVLYVDNDFYTVENQINHHLDFFPLPPSQTGGLPLYYTAGPVTSVQTFDQNVTSLSVFANGTFHFNNNWEMTVGVRYTDEERNADWDRLAVEDASYLHFGVAPELGVFMPMPTASAPTYRQLVTPDVDNAHMNRSEENVDGSINISYVLEDARIYASWALGSKSGGFSTQARSPEDAEFEREEAETVELGIKSDLMGGKLRLNAAAFLTDIENLQTVSFVGTGFLTDTIPVRSKGVEIEVLWAATENLTLGLSSTYADAEDLETGFMPAQSPKLTAAFTLQHTTNLFDNLSLDTNLSANYRSDQYSQKGETFKAPAITYVDARFALSQTNGGWELAVLAKNLLDEEDSFSFSYPLFGAIYGTSVASVNRGRTVSLQASYKF